jgi:hypothetical protein
VEVISSSDDVREVRILPLPLIGGKNARAASPDVAKRSQTDSRAFSGLAWLMASGSWQVKVQADGARGKGELSVPLPVLAHNGESMSKPVAILLLIMLLLLAAGAIGIAGATVREATLPPGEVPALNDFRRARIATGITGVVLAASVSFAAWWWNDEADSYARFIPKTTALTPQVSESGRLTLLLKPDEAQQLNDLTPDHGHLMHLFLIRLPGLDQFWHLHPEQVAVGRFEQDLPAIPAGRYRLFADIVHQDGLLETVTAQMDFQQIAGSAPRGDDSGGSVPMLSKPALNSSPLSDGGRIVWERDTVLVAQHAGWLRFRVEDANGQAASNLELYMGMAAHAVVLGSDGSVFAHIHPMGSAPMAAISLANPSFDPHLLHHSGAIPPIVSFPYGFPKAGDYRIFVQIKRAGRVETGIFDLRVGPAGTSTSQGGAKT